MNRTTSPTLQVVELGEDGEWLAAEGHVDPTQFIAAADEYVRQTWGYADDDEMPSKWGPPEHTYYRPVTFEDCRRDVVIFCPGLSIPERHGRADLLLEKRQAEGWKYPCAPDHAGAEPWTEVRMP